MIISLYDLSWRAFKSLGGDIDIEAIRKEWSYFENLKGELLKTQKGKFALNELPRSKLQGIRPPAIKGEELVGTFTTTEEAYREGVR